jgi:hypothetical protein
MNNNYTILPQQTTDRRVSIVSLILQETPEYQDQYVRPYDAYIDEQTIDIISDRVNRLGAGSVNSSAVTGLDTPIIMPSAIHQGVAPIANSWNNKRMRFVLEALVTNVRGHVSRFVFQGYTDYCGISMHRSIDLNMILVINSYVLLNNITDPSGVGNKSTLLESSQVINGSGIYPDRNNNSDKYIMRPYDIFTGIQSRYLEDTYNRENPGIGYFDPRHIVGYRESARANRSNSNPTQYLIDILGSYKTSIDGNAIDCGGVSDIYGQCRLIETMPSICENPFIRAMAACKGGGPGTTFTFQDLLRLDPNTDRVTTVMTRNLDSRTTFLAVENSCQWNGGDRCTVIASMLGNAVPALMVEYNFTKISFTANNFQGGRDPILITILTAHGLTTADVTRSYEMFKLRLKTEILLDMSYGNQESFSIIIHADLYGDTRMEIEIGRASGAFVMPSFCDSLLSPIVTNSKKSFEDNTTIIERLVDNIREVTIPSNNWDFGFTV